MSPNAAYCTEFIGNRSSVISITEKNPFCHMPNNPINAAILKDCTNNFTEPEIWHGWQDTNEALNDCIIKVDVNTTEGVLNRSAQGAESCIHKRLYSIAEQASKQNATNGNLTVIDGIPMNGLTVADLYPSGQFLSVDCHYPSKSAGMKLTLSKTLLLSLCLAFVGAAASIF